MFSSKCLLNVEYMFSCAVHCVNTFAKMFLNVYSMLNTCFVFVHCVNTFGKIFLNVFNVEYMFSFCALCERLCKDVSKHVCNIEQTFRNIFAKVLTHVHK